MLAHWCYSSLDICSFNSGFISQFFLDWKILQFMILWYWFLYFPKLACCFWWWQLLVCCFGFILTCVLCLYCILGCSFQLVGFIGSWNKGLLPMGVLGLLLLSTWPLSLSTSLLRFLSWLEMLAKISRWRELPQGIFSWQLGEMRSWTPWLKGPLLGVESFLTSTSPLSTRPPRNKLIPKGINWWMCLILWLLHYVNGYLIFSLARDFSTYGQSGVCLLN